MKRKLRWLTMTATALALAACVVYEPMVVPGSTVQQRYDRAWSAALGAMYDQGVSVSVQDRGAGVIRGERGGMTITGTLQAMPDGSVQVKFTSSGPKSADPDLIHRVSDSYDRRMGM
ncbi:MAG TPA: hypothetical protein VL742_03005 [Casimicrobiaceae bacterium]|nr:hypothetical protein [Casimicrobiaceae bacterium]